MHYSAARSNTASPILSPAPGLLPDEALRALRHVRPNARAGGRLPKRPGPPQHVRLQLLQRDGRPVAAVRPAQLQGQGVLPEARRVQEVQRLGRRQPEGRLPQKDH